MITNAASAQLPAPSAEQVRGLHADAVALARSGDHGAALTTLMRLHEAVPGDRKVLYDLVVVLTWAERFGEAYALRAEADPDTAPGYVLLALGRAAREVGELLDAVAFYRLAAAHDPNSLDARLGLALTWIDAGEHAQARTLLDVLVADHRQSVEPLRALAYLEDHVGDPLARATAYQRVLMLAPGDVSALRGKAGALADLGAPHLALELEAKHPGALPSALKARLLADRAATEIRWGELPPPSPARRFEGTDRALAALDAAAGGEWSDLDPRDPEHRRLLLDRLVALRDRVRMEEAAALHARLEQAGVELAPYALIAAADAYLYLEQPERARDLYQAALAVEPDNFNAQLSLYYALAESEDHEAALALVDAVADRQPAWRVGEDPKIVKPNPKKALADQTAAMARAFADDLAASERRLSAMRDQAPANTEVASELAAVHRWRGWQERALAEYEHLVDIEPTLIGARIGAAHARIDLADLAGAEQPVATLAREFPENKHVQALARRWHLVNSAAIAHEFETGKSSGGAERGSDFLRMETRLHSPPIEHRTRVYARHLFEQASFPEGDGRSHRVAIGVEHQLSRLKLALELATGNGDHTELGISATGQWRLSDQWRLAAGLETSSEAIALRARRAGVTAHRASASLVHRWHESQQARLAAAYTDYSDGNASVELGAEVERRMLTGPRGRLAAQLGLFASAQRRQDVVYYSPRRDLSLDVALEGTHRIRRRYQEDWVHRLRGAAGGYAQDGFGTHATWSLEYGHEWTVEDQARLELGVLRQRRVYDGEPEYESVLRGALSARF